MANTRRENRLEELGRVDAEKAYTSKGKRNLRDEKHRIRSELKTGGMARAAQKSADTFIERVGGGEKGKPHSTKEGRMASGKRKLKRFFKQRLADRYHRDDPSRPTPPKMKPMPWKPGEKPKMQPLKKGGKVKNGLSPAQSHYLQHGYGPHKRDKKAVGGVIKGAIKAAKTVAAPGTHIRNVASGIKHGATKLMKGLPKIAKRGWK
jgi:hypothetical protein